MRDASDQEIIDLIETALRNNTETDSVEFKDARAGLPSDLWKSITAFSNKHSGGGIIVFGVPEDKSTRKFSVVKLPNVHDLQERASNYFADRIVNADRPDYRIIEVRGQQLLAMALNSIQDEKKPCFDQRHGMDRGAYIRDGNTDRPITDDELRHFIRNSSVFKYDITAAENIGLEELDQLKIERVLREMSVRTGRHRADNSVTATVMTNIKIAVDTNNGVRPTLAGALAFSSVDFADRAPFNRYAIRCVRYAGTTPATDIIDSQDIFGTLDDQIESAQAFVLRNISRNAVIEGVQRVERYEYPEEAIREVLANAVVHRDYSITENQTQVRIFSDRIEISNPGNLAPGITVDNIKEMQFSRNAVLASLMRDLNYLEEYGRGIDLVFSTMHSRLLPRPIFRNTANMFTVTLLGNKFIGLSERQLIIWQIILNHSRVSAKTIVGQINTSRPTVISDLTKLIGLGLVVPIGSGPSTMYEIGTGL